MKKQGPFVIVEDDLDDQDMVRIILQEDLGVSNELLFFDRVAPALSFLIETRQQPFIILSDVNLPNMSGLDLRRRINENDYLREKSIPFVFFTTSANKKDVREAFLMTVQGYFEKPHTVNTLRDTLRIIINYWDTSLHPNSF